MEKSDLLVITVGTNPFPNIITAITRVKQKGEIYLLYTANENSEASHTSIICTRLEKLITKKIPSIKIHTKEINKNLVTEITREIYSLVEKVVHSGRNIKQIELNFTGGTKAMSAGSYAAFSQLAKKFSDLVIINSYLDPEKESMVYKSIQNNESTHCNQSYKEFNPLCDLNILDISEIQVNKINGNKLSEELYNKELSTKIFDLFVNADKEQYEAGISFLTKIYYDIKSIDKKPSRAEELDEEFLKGSLNLLNDYKTYKDFAPNGIKDKKLFDFLQGDWFEDYVLNILLELKEELGLWDVKKTVKRDRSKYVEEFEVDLVALKKYKMFCFSVTSQRLEEESLRKLHEVSLRGKQLGGDETGVCIISLCPNSAKIEERMLQAWEDEFPRNILVIGFDRLSDIKDRLRRWIK